jgi:hypothetical protein
MVVVVALLFHVMFTVHNTLSVEHNNNNIVISVRPSAALFAYHVTLIWHNSLHNNILWHLCPHDCMLSRRIGFLSTLLLSVNCSLSFCRLGLSVSIVNNDVEIYAIIFNIPNIQYSIFLKFQEHGPTSLHGNDWPGIVSCSQCLSTRCRHCITSEQGVHCNSGSGPSDIAFHVMFTVFVTRCLLNTTTVNNTWFLLDQQLHCVQ